MFVTHLKRVVPKPDLPEDADAWTRRLRTGRRDVAATRPLLAASSDDGSHWDLRTAGPDLGDGDQITMTLT